MDAVSIRKLNYYDIKKDRGNVAYEISIQSNSRINVLGTMNINLNETIEDYKMEELGLAGSKKISK